MMSSDKLLSNVLSGLKAAGVERGSRNRTVAEKTGYSEGTVNGILSGNAKITSRFIQAICTGFGIRREWIETGGGTVLDNGITGLHQNYKLPVETADFSGGIDDWDTVRGYAVLEIMQILEKLTTEQVVSLVMRLRKETGFSSRQEYEKDTDGQFSTVKILG